MRTEYYSMPKELMFAISDLNLNGSQWKIFWNVFINNYDNGSREMPLKTISQVTNMHAKQVQRELKKMINRKILKVVTIPDYINARVLNINQNTTEWIN